MEKGVPNYFSQTTNMKTISFRWCFLGVGTGVLKSKAVLGKISKYQTCMYASPKSYFPSPTALLSPSSSWTSCRPRIFWEEVVAHPITKGELKEKNSHSKNMLSHANMWAKQFQEHEIIFTALLVACPKNSHLVPLGERKPSVPTRHQTNLRILNHKKFVSGLEFIFPTWGTYVCSSSS